MTTHAHTVRTRLFWLTAAATLPVSLWGCSRVATSSHLPSSLVTSGTMTEAELFQITALDQKARSGTPLTASDIDWLLAIARRKSTAPYFEGTKADKVAHPLVDSHLAQVSASQRTQIFQFASGEITFWQSYQPAVVAGHPRSLENVPMGACLLLKHFRTPEATAQIKRLLSSSNPNIRQFAQQTLANPNI